MSRVKLTEKTVANAKPVGGQRTELWDSLVPGFGLRVSSTRKTWCVAYRHRGRKRRMNLGTYPTVPLSKAREDAREALAAAGKGEDPAADRMAARAPRATTVQDLAEAYVERHAKPNKRTWESDQRRLQQDVLPRWGRAAPDEITRGDVIALLDEIVNRGAPVQANRVLETVRKMFGWAVEKDLLSASPVAGVKKPAKEQTRDRVLTDDELAAVWNAAGGMGYPFGPFFKLLLLTAQRRGEVAAMRWRDIDASRAEWTLPAAHTKSGRPHMVPLPEPAMAILRELPVFDGGGYVFPARNNPESPISGISKALVRLQDRSGTEDWRIHDLRRSGASGMARLGHPPHVISAVLNHSPGQSQGITAVYNRHSYAAEKREALTDWAHYLGQCATTAEATTV